MLKPSASVIIRWFGKFKKLTTEKRNLHFIEIKGFGKNLNVLAFLFLPQYVEPPTSEQKDLDNSLFSIV
jgi:hypothetical protein